MLNEVWASPGTFMVDKQRISIWDLDDTGELRDRIIKVQSTRRIALIAEEFSGLISSCQSQLNEGDLISAINTATALKSEYNKLADNDRIELAKWLRCDPEDTFSTIRSAAEAKRFELTAADLQSRETFLELKTLMTELKVESQACKVGLLTTCEYPRGWNALVAQHIFAPYWDDFAEVDRYSGTNPAHWTLLAAKILRKRDVVRGLILVALYYADQNHGHDRIRSLLMLDIVSMIDFERSARTGWVSSPEFDIDPTAI